MNITVYCGSSHGADPDFTRMTIELGKWIGENGHTLVYGAGKVGAMGVVADAAIEYGGRVIGVTPGFFIEMDEIHDNLAETIVVKNLSERRAKMLELGEAFIALPGGMGTLDEITEVCANNRLKQFDNGSGTRPAILFNVNGYYDSFLAHLRNMIAAGFYKQEEYDHIVVANSIEDIAEALK